MRKMKPYSKEWWLWNGIAVAMIIGVGLMCAVGWVAVGFLILMIG